MAASDTKVFTCMCKEVEIHATGQPIVQFYCHCTDCRASKGAEYTAEIIYPSNQVSIAKGADGLCYYMRTTCKRAFCKNCGTNLMNLPSSEMTGVFPATADTYEFKPELHIWYNERVTRVQDGLPKFSGVPVDFGGEEDVLMEE